MMIDLGRLPTAPPGTRSPWLAVSAVPVHPAPAGFSAASGGELGQWVSRQVAGWPAPVPIGSERPETHADKLTFTPSRPPSTYHCELHADGSALGALQVGSLRDSPPDGGQVWAVGEGALAWITIALLRLTAAYGIHTGVLGGAVVEAAVISPGDGVPMEIWNHAHGLYGPAGDRQVTEIASARCTADLATCLSPGLAATARPLVVDLLGRFGLSGSRHIDPAGVIQRGHFTGYDGSIHAWADAIGVPSAP
ncbi:hypothetical protein ACIBQX_02095 [Nonomuraea sp. NPDC049714]|uniref:hypothetical protein n=1 Tax=Nonomuraea sp. NPDC049714 TaxID=3364357 RepID=UPI00379F8611